MTGHSDLYIQLQKAGVPQRLAESAANIQHHAGVPPGLLDILAAVIAAVNARCDRLEAQLEQARQPLNAIGRTLRNEE